MIDSPLAVLTVLTGVAAGALFVERWTQWRLFRYFPPLLFIYFVPMILSNAGLLAREGPVYDWMSDAVLPFLLVIMLLKVDVVSAVRVMGRGMLVMLCGSAGVILGAPLVYSLVKDKLDPTAWKAFGALAGSWIGGTANLMGVGQGIGASPTEFGLAVLGDNMGYIVWLPILLASKGLAPWFNRFTRVDPKRIAILEQVAVEAKGGEDRMQRTLYLPFRASLRRYCHAFLLRLRRFSPPAREDPACDNIRSAFSATRIGNPRQPGSRALIYLRGEHGRPGQSRGSAGAGDLVPLGRLPLDWPARARVRPGGETIPRGHSLHGHCQRRQHRRRRRRLPRRGPSQSAAGPGGHPHGPDGLRAGHLRLVSAAWLCQRISWNSGSTARHRVLSVLGASPYMSYSGEAVLRLDGGEKLGGGRGLASVGLWKFRRHDNSWGDLRVLSMDRQ
jgi:hypothetical protein